MKKMVKKIGASVAELMCMALFLTLHAVRDLLEDECREPTASADELRAYPAMEA